MVSYLLKVSLQHQRRIRRSQKLWVKLPQNIQDIQSLKILIMLKPSRAQERSISKQLSILTAEQRKPNLILIKPLSQVLQKAFEHTKTKANSPQTNAICEGFHKTMKQEFYDTAFRKKIYHSCEELQQDVDTWLIRYNNHRSHSGKYCYGKTPMQTFLDSKHIALEKSNESM